MRKAPKARCEECTLFPEPYVPSYGPSDADFIVVGEAPGQLEAKEGKPFVGQSGQLLDAVVTEVGGDPECVLKMNVVACRPPRNRTPTTKEIACCAPRLFGELAQVPVTKVLALGKTATTAFNLDWKQRGALYDRLGKVMMCAWHPAYVLRTPSEAPELMACLRRAVQDDWIVNAIPTPKTIWIKGLSDLEQWLAKCPDNAWVSFDIETDNVIWFDRPGTKADAILMMQLAWTEEFGIVIGDDLLYDVPSIAPTLQAFFDRVRIIGWNCKFDCVFVKSHLGLRVQQDFDGYLAHYALDENLMHGLKYVACPS